MILLILLTLCSSMMYLLERNSPDPNMQRYYSTPLQSMWMTLLNLSGEAPLCDYSPMGMFIGAGMAIFGSAVAGVPIGIIGSAFGDALDDDDDEEDHDEDEEDGVELKSLNNQTGVIDYGSISSSQTSRSSAHSRRALLSQVFHKFDHDGSGELDSLELFTITQAVGLSPRDSEQLMKTADKNRNSRVDEAEFTYAFDMWLPSEAVVFDAMIKKLMDFGEERIALTEQHPIIGQIHRLVSGFGYSGRVFVSASVTFTLFAVAVEILQTVHEVQQEESNDFHYKLELFLTLWFTTEILLRSIGNGVAYIKSMMGMVDMLATFPWYVTHISTNPTLIHTARLLRFARLLRLLRLDTYSPSLSLIVAATQRCSQGLWIALSTFVVIWFGFSSWLFLAEHDDAAQGEERRFRSPASSLQYAGVLLTGDYPIVDFSPAGKAACCLAVLAAVGICAVPASVIAESFVELLQEETERIQQKRRAAATRLQALFRGSVSRKIQELTQEVGIEVASKSDDVQDSSVAKMGFLHTVANAKKHKTVLKSAETSQIASLQSWKSSSEPNAVVYRNVFIALVFMNVAAVVLESVPEVEQTIPHAVWQGFEGLSVVVFTIDYFLCILTSAYDPVYHFSRWRYIISFNGLADLFSVLPYYVEVVFLPILGLRSNFDATVFRVLRLNSVFSLEAFSTQFVVMNQVLDKVAPVLQATLLLALILWVAVASAFYYAELHTPHDFEGEDPQQFDSILDSLYYTGIFMAGEWAAVDFTPLGAWVCIFTAWIGVALFSIPIGILFEAFQDTLQETCNGYAKHKEPKADSP